MPAAEGVEVSFSFSHSKILCYQMITGTLCMPKESYHP